MKQSADSMKGGAAGPKPAHSAPRRKRRTREHVIASLSVNYVERFILEEGHTVERIEHDYGYDLVMITHDGDGCVEPGYVYIQLKASDVLPPPDPDAQYIVQLDVKDHGLWCEEPMPVILVLYDAARRRAYWLYIQEYFEQDARRKPRPNARSIRLRVPIRNRMSCRAVQSMRGRKRRVLQQVRRVIHHDL
jgi:hypothetical protein